MDKAKAEKNDSNRRRAIRVYEQVDLIFHKIDFNQEQLKNTGFNNILSTVVQSFDTAPSSSTTTPTSIEPLLPASHSQKNNTLNINISSTGISFTCNEKLMAADYLMIRVLLLSSMTVITTSCKVVYVKPSNPHEKNQYPYTIGARFIKLKPEDQKILDEHIKRKRSRRLIMKGVLAFFILIFIQVPDLFFELIVDLFSFIIEEFFELLHLFYELVEYGLDLLIEHIFHTGMRSTQTIVFYVQAILTIALSIPLFRKLLSFSENLFHSCQLYLYRKKASIFYSWEEKTLEYKVGLSGVGIVLTVFLGSFLT